MSPPRAQLQPDIDITEHLAHDFVADVDVGEILPVGDHHLVGDVHQLPAEGVHPLVVFQHGQALPEKRGWIGIRQRIDRGHRIGRALLDKRFMRGPVEFQGIGIQQAVNPRRFLIIHYPLFFDTGPPPAVGHLHRGSDRIPDHRLHEGKKHFLMIGV